MKYTMKFNGKMEMGFDLSITDLMKMVSTVINNDDDEDITLSSIPTPDPAAKKDAAHWMNY